MADKLTPQQEMAVTSRGGKLLVSAAAGSGKTKVLVDRLLGFLTQTHDPANLDEFLIITYTKAAASELRGENRQKADGGNCPTAGRNAFAAANAAAISDENLHGSRLLLRSAS